MRTNLWALLGILAASSVGCGSSSSSNAGAGDTGTSQGTDGGANDTGIGAGDDTGVSTGDDTGVSTDDTGTNTDSGTGAACGQGSIIEGDVDYVDPIGGPPLPNAAGQGLFADPPISIDHLAFVGETIHASTNTELWAIDTTKATPQIVRYAGVDPSTEGGNNKLQDGPCASARLPQITGLAAAPDGSLFATDELANAVVHITSPGAAGCSLAFYAGTSTAQDVPPAGVNEGDANGPGATALLTRPTHPVVDAAGNVFFVDGHWKVKKIATDAQHTVSTVATLPAIADDDYSTMTMLKGKLYLTYLDGTTHFIQVDPTTGAQTTILDAWEGGGEDPQHVFAPLLSSDPAVQGLTTDGTVLYAYGKGYVWTVTTAGVVTYAAGDGAAGDFTLGYDPHVAHAAADIELTCSDEPGFAYHAGSLYFRGAANTANTSFITKIGCP